MSNDIVLSEIERFLRVSRLNTLIRMEDESYLRAVELAWVNEAYKGPTKKITLPEWLSQTQTATLSR